MVSEEPVLGASIGGHEIATAQQLPLRHLVRAVLCSRAEGTMWTFDDLRSNIEKERVGVTENELHVCLLHLDKKHDALWKYDKGSRLVMLHAEPSKQRWRQLARKSSSAAEKRAAAAAVATAAQAAAAAAATAAQAAAEATAAAAASAPREAIPPEPPALLALNQLPPITTNISPTTVRAPIQQRLPGTPPTSAPAPADSSSTTPAKRAHSDSEHAFARMDLGTDVSLNSLKNDATTFSWMLHPPPPTARDSSVGMDCALADASAVATDDSTSADETAAAVPEPPYWWCPAGAEVSGPSRLRCNFAGCGRQFARTGDLNRHKLTHTGERPYACGFEGCGRRFAVKDNLKTHTRTHTGERPYKCDVVGCGLSFARSDVLNVHKPIHGREHSAYLCDFEGCGQSFAQSAKLDRHKLSKHYTCVHGNQLPRCKGRECVQLEEQIGQLASQLLLPALLLPSSTSHERSKRPRSVDDWLVDEEGMQLALAEVITELYE